MNIYFIEGLGGSGKTTIAEAVGERLGIPVSRLPYYENETGKKIKEAIDNNKKGLTEPEFQKLMLENYKETLLGIKNSGVKDIIITRGVHSMMAYGTAFSKTKSDMLALRNVFIDAISFINSISNSREILIKVPLKTSLSRIKKRGDVVELFETEDVLSSVYNYYNNVRFDLIVDNTLHLRSAIMRTAFFVALDIKRAYLENYNEI